MSTLSLFLQAAEARWYISASIVHSASTGVIVEACRTTCMEMYSGAFLVMVAAYQYKVYNADKTLWRYTEKKFHPFTTRENIPSEPSIERRVTITISQNPLGQGFSTFLAQCTPVVRHGVWQTWSSNSHHVQAFPVTHVWLGRQHLHDSNGWCVAALYPHPPARTP